MGLKLISSHFNLITIKVIKIIRKVKKKMSEQRNQKRSNKKNKCGLKCRQCEFYDRKDDYCVERDIENCSRQTKINFSKCNEFLVKENLVMF
jgi:hypothetical protein